MDLIIALGLVGIVVVVFIISQMGILPKKTLPYVIGALAGLLGITLFREWRTKGLTKKIAEQEKILNEKEEKLKELKEKYMASDRELQKAKEDLEKQIAAYKKMLLQLQAETREEKEKIDQLAGEELDDKFSELLTTLKNT